MSKKHLFICGCPRSGTTALCNLLCSDPRIALGIERYGHFPFSEKRFVPELFERERFFTVQPGDTFYKDAFGFNERHYRAMQDKFDSAIYVGDKVALLFTKFASLADSMPDAKVLVIVRNIFDVAASYVVRADNENDHTWRRDKRTQEAVGDWRASLVAMRDAPANLARLTVIYEELFRKGRGLEEIFEFLELGPPSESAYRSFKGMCARADQLEKQRTRSLVEDDLFYISQTAPFGLYRELTKGRFSR